MEKSRYANGITDANYLYIKFVGDRSNGEAPLLERGREHGTYVLHEDRKKGKAVVIGCHSYPKLIHSYGFGFEGMDVLEIIEEMASNGMGTKISFSDQAYIRVLDSDGKPDPVVFRDMKDALAYLGED